jgi:hypothetical protein
MTPGEMMQLLLLLSLALDQCGRLRFIHIRLHPGLAFFPPLIHHAELSHSRVTRGDPATLLVAASLMI